MSYLSLREVQEMINFSLFINITPKQQSMKKILFALVMLVSAVGLAQTKTFEQIDEDTVEVTIKHQELPTQKGQLVNVNGLFKPHGIWTEYDKNDRVTLRVMFAHGKKLWVEKDLGAYVVLINRRGDI